MTIVYGLIAVGQTVLAEHTSTSVTGNFPTVTRVLLDKIPNHDGKMTYQYDNYNFHYVCENGICYLCMSDNNQGSAFGGVRHRIPFAFLVDMKERFVTIYGTEAPLQAIAFSYNEEFSRTIEDRMNYYNSDQADRSIDNIGLVKGQIEDVKDVMVQNIERVLERGEKIELLVDKTDRLTQQAFRFESSSRRLQQAMYYKKIRCYIAIGFSIALLILVGSASMCGGITFHTCRRK